MSGSHAAGDPASGFSDHPALATASSAALPPGTPTAPSAGQPQGAAGVAPALSAADTVSVRRATSTDPLATKSGAAVPAHITPAHITPAHITPAHITPAPAAITDADVACALPFLLLGPLDQTGYLAALGPALQRRPSGADGGVRYGARLHGTGAA